MKTISNKTISKNNWNSCEGQRGLKNLARIVSYLGYKDINQFGLFEANVAYSNIFQFLEQNPGAIEKLIEFILETHGEDQEELEDEEQLEDD